MAPRPAGSARPAAAAPPSPASTGMPVPGTWEETAMTVQTLDDIRELAQQLRVDSIRCSTAAGSGHPTSSMSAADVMAVLLARYFRYDWRRPDDPANDHLILPQAAGRERASGVSRGRYFRPGDEDRPAE